MLALYEGEFDNVCGLIERGASVNEKNQASFLTEFEILKCFYYVRVGLDLILPSVKFQ